ncbi:MAG TPA: protoporphyrinogen oxidase [Blastocatellia bacterium]|nr:protoporphyrinogen oxidase [Blastocatellia bacterium]HMV82510.1 protoporphyrinogen oxidase [Blastocatellia bacterium]HNG30117.1 protoporphyrinogen oxidase [Blastocatellia bacterium]
MNFDAIIIGAGISGLVAAHRLKKLGQRVLVLESGNNVGGVIQSHDADGFLIEAGPNSLRGAHELLDLVEELNLMNELVTADPKAPAFVFSGGELHAVPMGPGALVKSKLLSASAKLRLLAEPFVKGRKAAGEESIDSFIRRRLGDEVMEKLVAPFLSGVYAGDPTRLSVQACFPKLAEFEADAGSILRGGIKAMRGRQRPQPPKRSLRPYRLCSFRRGLNTLPQRLAEALGEGLLTATQVTAIRQTSSGFELTAEAAGESRLLTCRTLIVAAPAYAAAKLLAKLTPEAAALLGEIPYAAIASVPLAYRTEQFSAPLGGFGFLAPRSEGLRTLGSIWNSSLFTERAPENWMLTTNFIGGATDPEAVRLGDDELVRIVHGDLSKALRVTGEPRRLPIRRWERAIPQYELGHAARVAKLDAALARLPGLHLAGNYLRGVAIGDCIRQAEELAREITDSTKARK